MLLHILNWSQKQFQYLLCYVVSRCSCSALTWAQIIGYRDLASFIIINHNSAEIYIPRVSYSASVNDCLFWSIITWWDAALFILRAGVAQVGQLHCGQVGTYHMLYHKTYHTNMDSFYRLGILRNPLIEMLGWLWILYYL